MAHAQVRRMSLAVLLTIVVGGIEAFAQSPGAEPATPDVPAAETTAAAPPESGPKPFKEEEIAALVAPIALYPDQVVAQVLMASTYPLEVVQAHRWLGQNAALKPEQLAAEAKKQGWDDSVVGLVALPDVLKMMDEKLDWTQQLGDAVLAQQQDVMAMIQTLRAKAKEEGNLESDEHVTVKVEPAPAAAAAPTAAAAAPASTTTVIYIEPTDPEVIYVPSYSPTVVYGSWWYPAYPPYYFPPPVGYYPGTGLAWGVSVGIGIAIWDDVWDNNCNWHGNDIDIDIDRGDINIDRGDVNIGSGDRAEARGGAAGDRAGQTASASDRSGKSWSHDPEHRKGAGYRDTATASKYDRTSANRATSSDAYRGRSGSGAQTRPSAGSGAQARPSTGAGGGASSRPAGSPSASTLGGGGRPSGGSPTLSGGNLGASSSRVGSGSGGASSRPSGSGSYRGSAGSGASTRGGAYSGMSSGARASSYGSRGAASRGGGGMSRGGGGGRRR